MQKKINLAAYGVDSFLVTNPYNIYYLTGFQTLSSAEREAYLFITGEKRYVFTDGRYYEQFKNQNVKFKVSTENSKTEMQLLTGEKGLVKHMAEIISKNNISSLGFEKEDLKYEEYERLKTSVPVEIKPLDRVILGMRSIKTTEEILNVQKACKVADSCLSKTVPLIKPGVTEKEIAWRMEKQLRSSGYDLSFDPIVAFDAHCANPHYDTKGGDGVVREDSLILIDFGVKYRQYCSDITRMFFMKGVSGEIRQAYDVLKTAQQKTIEHIRAGGKLSGVDEFCRKMIVDNGCKHGIYPHSTGHGVGLEIHEYPKVSGLSLDSITNHQVFTIEPGIYMPGRWGMRIEDTVVIGEDGKAEVLTKYSKI